MRSPLVSPQQHREPHDPGDRVIAAFSRACAGDRTRVEGRAHPSQEGRSLREVMRSGPAGAEAVLRLIQRVKAGAAG